MDSESLAQVTSALEVVHRPLSSPQERQEAQALLDSLKEREDAAWIGYSLASPGTQAVIRHFGLTLLQHAINHQFSTFTEEKWLTVRNWVVELAFFLTIDDPHYVREKISYLWVSLAKRVWGINTRPDQLRREAVPTDGWVQMDTQLLELWNQSGTTREFTNSVLRTLFEDLYLLDDPIASKRSGALSAQCTEIVMPASDIAAVYDARDPNLKLLRANDEGWLSRWIKDVNEYSGAVDDELASRNLLRTLETLKSCLYWSLSRTVVSLNVLEALLGCFKHPSPKIRIAACDNLNNLFTRTYTRPQDFERIVGRILMPEGVQWLKFVYNSINIDADDIDDLEYVYLKKVVELIVGLGEFIQSSEHALPSQTDFHGFLSLVMETTQHPSLLASGLSLQFWCSILRLEDLLSRPDVEDLLPSLLKIASERCINYAHMPEDHASHKFMDVDFDSGLEAQAFYGNYRRYMEDIVRLIVCRIPLPSLHWLHQGMSDFFQTEYGWKVMNNATLSNSEPPYILAAAQITVVEAAIRGVSRWQVWATATDKDAHSTQILGLMAEWARELLVLSVKDAVLQRKLIETIVQFAPLLKNDHQVIFQILERMLTASTWEYPPEDPEHDDERERVRDLRTATGTELNRLAYMIPEALAQIYDDLDRVIADLLSSGKVREHESVSFKSFLLVVSQRSSLSNKAERFSAIVDPVLSSWTEETTMKGLMDLEWFMERVGIVRIAEYFRSRGITAETNLLETPIDDAGRALKMELKQKWQAIFPIRPTRIFIQYTIERLEHTSPEYLQLLSLWKPRIQPILPHILQLISQITAYHDPANWVNLPPEVQTFVKISCTERFWQAGVSMQTRDEFENQSLEASKTLRDFADSVGHIIRYTREYAFLTLVSISQLEDTMFGIDGIGRTIFQAIAGGNTVGVTSHSWRHLISLVARSSIKNCPAQYLESFMIGFVPPLLLKLGEVLQEKWHVQSEQGFQLMEPSAIDKEENLSEEMMDEHLLRQLTAIVVRLLMDLAKHDLDEHRKLVRNITLGNKEILSAVLKTAGEIMQFKDSRCCYNASLLINSVLAWKENHMDEDIAQFLLSKMIPTCLGVISDPYFHESYGEAASIIALIYYSLREQPERVFLRLQELIPGVGNAALEDLKVSLDSKPSIRVRRAVMLDFFGQHRVMQISDESRAVNLKTVELRLSRRNDDTDKYDATAVANMFDLDV